MAFEKFVLKNGFKGIEHGGYLITYNNHKYKTVCIFEELAPGKYKMRREIFGPQRGHDMYGAKVFEPITDLEYGIQKAKNFIDNFIKPWNEKSK